MSNPICSLREKMSTNNHALQRGQNLVPLQIGDKIHDYFTKNETFSVSGLLIMLVINSTCIKKKIITDY